MFSIPSIHSHWQLSGLVILCLVGCADPSTIGSKDATVPNEQVVTENPQPPSGSNTIVSDSPITNQNRMVTFGDPEVTEDVEKRIYKSLSYFRNLANAIEKNVPGGNAGSRQSRQDYSVAATAFKLKYRLSDADLDAIVKKGDERGWK